MRVIVGVPLIVGLTVAITAFVPSCEDAATEPKQAFHRLADLTFRGWGPRLILVKDLETGCEYLITDGVTPRLGPDGLPKCR